MSTVVIKRDPFTRTELVRAIVTRYIGCGCAWCGNYRRGSHHTLFMYGTAYDGRSLINWHTGNFCSKSCHDSYYC